MRDARPCVGSPPWLCVRGSRAAVCAVPVRTALRSRGVLCVTVLCYSVVLLWSCVGAVCVVLPMQCVLRQLMHACHVWAVFLRRKTLSRSLRRRPPMLLACGRGVGAAKLCSGGLCKPAAARVCCSARCHPCCVPVAEASVLRSLAPDSLRDVCPISWFLQRSATHAACPWQRRQCFRAVFQCSSS